MAEGKPKQQRIPGMVPEKIAAIEDAMEHYRSIRDERMQLTARESEANEALVKTMQDHKVEEYISPDGCGKVIIVTEQKIKAKVSSVKLSGDEAEE